ncbi:Nn.00g009210.m01.CDS01 [Neocucurbitaria sp. VM-36]
MAHERPLRILLLLTTALATPLLIATTIVSIQRERRRGYWNGQRSVTTFCFAYLPLALTAFASTASLLHHRKSGRSPGPRFAPLDCFGGVMYLAILLPIWAVEIGRLDRPGFALLAGYLTAPMIINMFVHFYFFIYNAQSVWLALSSSEMHECPNCRNNFIVGAPQVQQTSNGPEGYSLLRGEAYLDEDAVPYAEARASGEQISPESENKGEGKGKAIIDV